MKVYIAKTKYVGKGIFALKPIKKGEEITLDYSIVEEDPSWRMKCKCRNKSCRKTIRSIQFLDKRLFKKYYSYILDYLRNAYLKYHKL